MAPADDLTVVHATLDQIKNSLRMIRSEVGTLRTDQSGLRGAIDSLERSVARLVRILDGDPTVRHKGLLKEFEELTAAHGAVLGRVIAIEQTREAEKNRIEGMRVMLSALGGATGVSIIAQIFQFYQATKVP